MGTFWHDGVEYRNSWEPGYDGLPGWPHTGGHALGYDGVRFFDSWSWNPRYIYPGGHAMTSAAVMAKTPKYLKPEDPRPDTPPPLALGDRVTWHDGSWSLTLSPDGLVHDPVAYTGGGGPWRGRIVATDCVLPTDRVTFVDNRISNNDTIVACDNGKFVFTRIDFLRRLT